MEQIRLATMDSDVLSFSDHSSTQYSEPAPTTADVPVRKYHVMYLDRDGSLQETRRMARALPAFEQAFNVVKEGALVSTEHGMVPIENILPGDKARLEDGSLETIEWRGSITINAGSDDAATPAMPLTRFAADALGFSRPSPDLVLGQGARIKHRAAGIRRVSGSDEAFIPAFDFVDDNDVLSLQPATSYAVYQLGLSGQRSLMINGVAVESLHPGTAFELGLRGASLRTYLGLFPHKRSFEDFGLLDVPRLRLRDLDLLD